MNIGEEFSVDLNKGIWPLTLVVVILVGVHLLYPDPDPSIINPVEGPAFIKPVKELLITFAFVYIFMWIGATCHQLIKAIGGYRELLRLCFSDEEVNGCDRETLESENKPGSPHAP